MGGPATIDDVEVSAELFDPRNNTYEVLSVSGSRRTGSPPDSINIRVKASPRFKKLLEFDGSFTLVTPGNFARSLLPKPDVGDELSSADWALLVTPFEPGDDPFFIKPLILTEATVEQANLAEGSQGPFVPDSGQDRLEIWSLSFSDTRLLWREMGFVAGRRNVRDYKSSLREIVNLPAAVLKITAPVIENDSKTEGKIKLGSPEEIEIQIPEISDRFDPSSINGSSLHTSRELLEEIAGRVPFAALWDEGSKIGPEEILTQLEKLPITGIDYGVGTSPADAFERIAAKAGLIVGLKLDGRIFVEFDAVPSAAEFEKSGIVNKQAKYVGEPRGARVRPRSPSVRFYPNRVVKEIVIDEFEEVAKDTRGNLVPLTDLAGRIGASIPHIRFLMAIKSGTDPVGRKNQLESPTFDKIAVAILAENAPVILENELQIKTPDVSEVSSSERQSLADTARNLSDFAGRGYRYAPSGSTVSIIKTISQTARTLARQDLQNRSASVEPFGDGGKSPLESKIKTFELNTPAVLDSILATPLKIVTKVDEVGDLSPRWIADLILHRTYDFVGAASAIAFGSFGELSPNKFGFSETANESLISRLRYHGKRLGEVGNKPGRVIKRDLGD